MKPTVIRASAGTGKTYRLSLEFINLLLKYRIDFEEILVITFTKKATAEIRARIFQHLKEITSDSEVGDKIKSELKKINQNLKFDQQELTFLQKTQHQMLTNKSAVNISTIDSFVNTIFSGIIAPYHKIMDFKIDNNVNEEILPRIYESILQKNNLIKFKEIFLQAKKNNLDSYKNFFLDIIENRWLFEFIDFDALQKKMNEQLSEQKRIEERYQNAWQGFSAELQSEIEKNKKSLSKAINQSYHKFFTFFEDPASEPADFFYELDQLFLDKKFLQENHQIIFNKNIWNGNVLRSKSLKEIFSEIRQKLADYLYTEIFLPEQIAIIQLANSIFQKYDQIKFQEKIFTHSDISFYTLKFLFDPELSIIDQGNILNIFYEQLSYSTRFVLIDEFQDTSILQWNILRPMIKEILSGFGQKDYGNVIVVGDEKQAIYGWRGGERKLLTNFGDLIDSEINADSLKKSFRSKQKLMTILNRLFDPKTLKLNQNWEYSPLDCHQTEAGFFQLDLVNTEKKAGLQPRLSKEMLYEKFVDELLLKAISEKSLNLENTAILMRKNNELEIMSRVLQRKGIEHTLETSGSLFQYHAIKPIFFLLNFLAYEDVLELLKFLRSDLILMYPDKIVKLLDIYQASENIADFLSKTKEEKILQKIAQIREQKDFLLKTLQSIIKEFSVTEIFAEDVELNNIYRLLEIAIEFEEKDHEYPKELAGFLRYCLALQDRDEYSQLGQSETVSLKLLTVHKAKGLEFETVFAVFDVMSKTQNNANRLKFYYQFSENFQRINDLAITFNYQQVLKNSSRKTLLEKQTLTEKTDELNNIYVALTRAKNNLFLYLHYKKKGDLEKFCKDIDVTHSTMKKIACALKTEFEQKLQTLNSYHDQLKFGTFTSAKKKSHLKDEKQLSFPDLVSILSWKDLQSREEKNFYQLQKEYLENKSILIGNVAHDYLAEIHYFSDEEKKIAENVIRKKYGSLLEISQIKNIFSELDNFITSHRQYFDQQKWDLIFNEKSIFDQKGREFRIDRLLIDSKNKQILIIDYKTGVKYDERQLRIYEEIIKEIPVFSQENYLIETKFLEIKLKL